MLRESVVQQLTNVEKLVAGKMSKQQYMDAETPLHKKKEEALEKIKVLLGNIWVFSSFLIFKPVLTRLPFHLTALKKQVFCDVFCSAVLC